MSTAQSLPSAEPPQPPASFYSDPKLLIHDVEAATDAYRDVLDALAANVKLEDATFDNVILPILHGENEWLDMNFFTKFLKDVSTDQDLRETARKIERIINDFNIESDLRQDIFKLVDAVYRNGERLDTECQYALEKLHGSYIKRGVAISDASQRDRFKQVQKRIAELRTLCNKTYADEREGLWLTPQDLDGVPENAVNNLKKGEGENQGKFWLTTKTADLNVFQSFAANAEVRKIAFLALENKCSDNIPRVREMYILRDEAARLLGYENNAALKIEDMMARSPRVVQDFLQDLQQRLTPAGQAAMEELINIKSVELKSRGLEASDDKKLYHWDVAYYTRLLKEQQVSLDQNKVSEYFPLGPILRGMLANFEHLLGLRIVDITTEAANMSAEGRSGLWHEDAKAFRLLDDDSEVGALLGYIYLDLHPRDFKRAHPTHICLQPVCSSVISYALGFPSVTERIMPSALMRPR